MAGQVDKPIDIMLADGNPLVLSAMSETFDKHPRFSLIATSATAEGFLGAVMRIPVLIAVIDWELPALGGEKLIEVLRAQPDPPRLVVYGRDDGEAPRRALAAGAAAFASRADPTETLIRTCLDVAAGKMVFPFVDIRKLREDPIASLSKREALLIEALADGLTNRELAAKFELSPNTVKFHLSNIFDKLSVKNRGQAIAHYYASRTRSGS